MLSTTLFFTIIFSLIYFLLESAILPNERLKLRYRLFQLRDELRWKVINEPNSLKDEEFKILSSAINSTIGNMGQIVPSMLWKAHRAYETDDKFRKAVQHRKGVINNSSNDFVKGMNENVRGLMLMALGINSGGWMLFIIPILILYKLGLSISRYALKVKSLIFRLIRIDDLTLAPSYMLKEFIYAYQAPITD